MNEAEVRALLRARIKDMGSQLAFARACRLSPQYLTDVLKGRRPVGPRILKQLGMRCVREYRTVA